MTGEVVVIFLAIVFVWAIVGPTQAPPVVVNKNYEEGEGPEAGPPNVVNHRPKRKPKPKEIPEESKTLTTDTFTRMMGKEKNNVRFE